MILTIKQISILHKDNQSTFQNIFQNHPGLVVLATYPQTQTYLGASLRFSQFKQDKITVLNSLDQHYGSCTIHVN